MGTPRGTCPGARVSEAVARRPEATAPAASASAKARERQERGKSAERGEEGSRERRRACERLSSELKRPDRDFELCDRSTLTCRRN